MTATRTLTAEEVRQRNQAVATMAIAQGIDAVIVIDPANVCYLSGFRTTLHTRFTAVALRTSEPGGATLVAPSVDKRLALEPVWWPSLLAETHIYYEGAPDSGELANNPGAVLDRVVRNGDTIGVDLSGASYGQVRMLQDRYPDSTIVDATDILHMVRRVKSPFEIDALRRANAVAIAALKQIPDLLRPGMTEIDLAAELDRLARTGGADGFA
jgi:Xaa-Pro aminopeptidase